MIKGNGKKYAIPSDFGLSSSSFTFAFVGLLLLVVAYPKFDITKVLAQSTEENNINTVRRVADAFNTGNVSILNVTGSNTGNFFILPPTGKNISYEAVHIYRIGEDGKIAEHKAIRDDLTFLAQLGVVKPSSADYEPFFQALTKTMNTTNSTGS